MKVFRQLISEFEQDFDFVIPIPLNTRKALSKNLRWDKGAFLPESIFDTLKQNMLDAYLKSAKKLTKQSVKLVDFLFSFFSVWELNKRVYQINKNLYPFLIDSDITQSKLPCAVLNRLPEFCMYVDISSDFELEGFFVRLYDDVELEEKGVNFYILFKNKRLSFAKLVFNDESINVQSIQVLQDDPNDEEERQIFNEVMNKVVNCLLYILSDNVDLKTEYYEIVPNAESLDQKAKMDNLEYKIPKKIHTFLIGDNLGKQLKQSQQKVPMLHYYTKGAGTPKRPHVRSGHWHTFYTGKRDGNQKVIYKWLCPIIIHGNS